ncbi:MAG: methionine aminotransferase [Cyclobacteriaceae bacterium]|nr:methionine aminotransferase [Cyclobacteriaceae bacterium]
MNYNILSKLPDVGTTIFTTMSKMANENGAINLSQGFPDFEVSTDLIELISSYMKKGLNQYAPMSGVPHLSNAISKMIANTRNVMVNSENEITVTSGATEAIYDIITATVQKNDEVILFDPAYDCYDPAIRLSGGTPIHIKLTQPDFSIDWEVVKNHINPRTKMIMINTPHNPTGAVLSQKDLNSLEDLIKDTNILVLSDEVYEHIIFDDKAHESVLKYPNLRQRSAAVYSFGKTFHATGWKMGYVVAPSWWTIEIRKVHQFVTFCSNTPVQYALADFIAEPENYEYVPRLYQEKRNYFTNLVKESNFKPVKCSGTYFQLLSYNNVEELCHLNDMEAAEKLTKKYGLASIPISVFYGDRQDDKLLRFCFAKGKETLKKATEILCKI